MSKIEHTGKSRLRRAFQRGMLIALGIAFLPLALVSTGLFLSGYQPADFNANLRYVLVGIWLAYVFSADRISRLDFWRRIPLLHSGNTGEVITVVAFAAIVASLRIGGGQPWFVVLYSWVIGFVMLTALFLALYAMFRAVTRSWQRAAHRARTRRAARRESGRDSTGETPLSAG